MTTIAQMVERFTEGMPVTGWVLYATVAADGLPDDDDRHRYVIVTPKGQPRALSADMLREGAHVANHRPDTIPEESL